MNRERTTSIFVVELVLLWPEVRWLGWPGSGQQALTSSGKACRYIRLYKATRRVCVARPTQVLRRLAGSSVRSDRNASHVRSRQSTLCTMAATARKPGLEGLANTSIEPTRTAADGGGRAPAYAYHRYSALPRCQGSRTDVHAAQLPHSART